jgi:hypothetical protein
MAAGPYLALALVVAVAALVARRAPSAAPGPEAFAFTAAVAGAGVLVAIAIAWAPSVALDQCPDPMLATSRCRESSLVGAGGLVAFLAPAAVAIAHLWREGALAPAAARVEAPAAPLAAAEPAPTPAAPPAPDRITAARVDGEATPSGLAVKLAAVRLRRSKVAVVFSGRVDARANEALAALADRLSATRVCVGEAGPHAAAATAAAGEGADHAAGLALSLAGGLFEAVILLDGDAELHDFALAMLPQIASVCLATRPTALTDACTIVLPVTDGEDDAAPWPGDALPRTRMLAALAAALGEGSREGA